MDNKETETNSGGSIREFGFAAVTFLIMIGCSFLAEWLEQTNRLSGDIAFDLKRHAGYMGRISLVLFSVWIYKSIGFPRTIGPDFKSRFNRGWREMSDKEAAKWMIIVFLGLFLGGAILMSR